MRERCGGGEISVGRLNFQGLGWGITGENKEIAPRASLDGQIECKQQQIDEKTVNNSSLHGKKERGETYEAQSAHETFGRGVP